MHAASSVSFNIKIRMFREKQIGLAVDRTSVRKKAMCDLLIEYVLP